MNQNTKHKTQSFISKFLLLFVLAIMLSNCQVEEDVVGQENKIQTVSLDEAISFLKQNPLKSISKTGKKTVSYPIFDAITQEKITNSDQLITVIPLSNANKQEYSRMLLLKIKDTIKSAVFSMYLDKDTKSKDFSGKIMITTIDGEFVNAFRVKNGALVSRFVIKTKTNASFKIQNRTIIIDGVEFEELNEVIIPPRNSSNTIQYNVLYDWSAYSDINGSGMEWNFGGGGGGGGGSDISTTANIVFVGPSNKISNINDYLKCFDLAQSAELIIYVDQPTANSATSWSGTITDPYVGHTFVAIQQGGIRKVFGFYPSTNVSLSSPNDSKAFGNDQGHTFDVSLSIPINPEQLLNVIGYANNAPPTYNLNTYNCTDFAIEIGNLVGLGLPDSYGTWPGGGGSNPGKLGQEIRNMALPTNTSRQTTGANAASNTGTCN
jgi:hypothetical protein